MRIFDYEADARPEVSAHGDAVEVQRDDGRPLFRLRMVGDALDIAVAGDDYALRDRGILEINPVSSNRVIVRRERREHARGAE